MKQKFFYLVFALTLVFDFVPFAAQALTYDEIVAGQGGLTYSYPTGALINDGGTIYFISGKIKVPFTNYAAFKGLGYSSKNVVKGDLSSYTPAQTYMIDSPEMEHPWGSWLVYKGTVYYSTSDRLVGVPNSQVFLANGGDWKYVVTANKYDLSHLDSPTNPPSLPMVENDGRVAPPPLKPPYLGDLPSTSNSPPDSRPQPPFSVTAAEAIAVDGSAKIYWSNVDGEKFYIYKNKNDGPFQFLDVTGEKFYKDTSGLSGDIKYGYYVTAVNSFGESDPSNKAYVGPVKSQKIPDQTNAPKISDLSPATGFPGTKITLTGSSFALTGNTVLSENSLQLAGDVSSSGTSLSFVLPSSAGFYCPSWYALPCRTDYIAIIPANFPNFGLQVVNVNGSSNFVNFTLTSP